MTKTQKQRNNKYIKTDRGNAKTCFYSCSRGCYIKNPVDEYVPLYKHQDAITTQFTMTTLEELGLLKMDFLGLRTLTVIRDTLDLIEKIEI